MRSGKPSQLGRHAVVGLACIFTASACSASAAGEPMAAWPSTPPTSGPPFVATAVATMAPDTMATAVPTSTATAAPSPLTAPDVVQASPTESTLTVPAESGADPEPETSQASKPKVRTIRLRPRPRRGPFSMNLYSKGDFMHQQTKDWCVAGSAQTMMNIMSDGKPNRSAAFQRRLYIKGRRLSPDKRRLGAIGVDLIGWRELLNSAGHGPYVVDGRKTRKGAIKRAAKAMRMTGKPVGLVVWRGAHSWVMSGFTATADPAYTNRFRVTRVNIQDVWYPYVSTIWGASRPPDAAVPVAALGQDYLPYRRPNARWPKRDGKFMLILPTLPRNTVAR